MIHQRIQRTQDSINAGFWGLVQQEGPWRTTALDIAHSKRESPLGTGGTLGRGGVLHSGHGQYETVITPGNVIASQNAPAASGYADPLVFPLLEQIQQRSIVSAASQKGGKPTKGIRYTPRGLPPNQSTNQKMLDQNKFANEPIEFQEPSDLPIEQRTPGPGYRLGRHPNNPYNHHNPNVHDPNRPLRPLVNRENSIVKGVKHFANRFVGNVGAAAIGHLENLATKTLTNATDEAFKKTGEYFDGILSGLLKWEKSSPTSETIFDAETELAKLTTEENFGFKGDNFSSNNSGFTSKGIRPTVLVPSVATNSTAPSSSITDYFSSTSLSPREQAHISTQTDAIISDITNKEINELKQKLSHDQTKHSNEITTLKDQESILKKQLELASLSAPPGSPGYARIIDFPSVPKHTTKYVKFPSTPSTDPGYITQNAQYRQQLKEALEINKLTGEFRQRASYSENAALKIVDKLEKAGASNAGNIITAIQAQNESQIASEIQNAQNEIYERVQRERNETNRAAHSTIGELVNRVVRGETTIQTTRTILQRLRAMMDLDEPPPPPPPTYVPPSPRLGPTNIYPAPPSSSSPSSSPSDEPDFPRKRKSETNHPPPRRRRRVPGLRLNLENLPPTAQGNRGMIPTSNIRGLGEKKSAPTTTLGQTLHPIKTRSGRKYTPRNPNI